MNVILKNTAARPKTLTGVVRVVEGGRLRARRQAQKALHTQKGEAVTSLLETESLNAHGVQVSEQKENEGPTTSSSVFSCDYQEDLFNVNAGKAILTLQEELPHVLLKDLTYDIYCDDVAFVDDISPKFRRKANTVVGKSSYKRIFWALRFHSWLFFCRSKFEVLKVWQSDDNVINVRWSFRGMPRIIGGALPGSTTYIDGISEFKLNRQGLIYEHRVDNLDHSSQFKLQDLTSLLNLNPSQPSWPKPSYYFEKMPKNLTASFSE